MKYRYFLCIFILFYSFVNISPVNALKAEVLSQQPNDYYANATGYCRVSFYLALVDPQYPVTDIRSYLPHFFIISPFPAFYVNSTTTILFVTLDIRGNVDSSSFPVSFLYYQDSQWTTVPTVDTQGDEYYFKCEGTPQPISQLTLLRPLEAGVMVDGKNSIFRGYVQTDLKRGFRDTTCSSILSACDVGFQGNGVYQATFYLLNTYTGDLTLTNPNNFVITINGSRFEFDNPLSTSLYQSQIVQSIIEGTYSSNSFSGALYAFSSNQNVLPIITEIFVPLIGTVKNFSASMSGSNLQPKFMTSKKLAIGSIIPYSQNVFITNTLSQSKTSGWDLGSLYYMDSSFYVQSSMKYIFGITTTYAAIVDTSYPFGLVSLSEPLPKFKISTMFSPYQSQYSINVGILYWSPAGRVIDGTIGGDTTAPVLEAIIMNPINNTHSVLSLQITDNLSGVGYIGVLDSTTTDNFYLNQQNLVNGTLRDGTFEKILPFQSFANFEIAIFDRAGNKVSFPRNMISAKFGLGISGFQRVDFDITYFKFKQANVDVSTDSVASTLYFNFTLPTDFDRKYTNVQFRPNLTPKKGFESKYYGGYNTATLLYEINFIIPAKTFPSYVPYTLYINDIKVGPYLIVSKFESDSRLLVTSSEFDQMFPVVTNFSIENSDVSLLNLVNIAWSLTVTDENFVKKVIVQVVGDFDPQGFNTTMEYTTRETSVVIPIKKTLNSAVLCKSQNYRIKYIYTEDWLGNFGETFRDVNGDIHPFYKFENANDNITVTCIQSFSNVIPSIIDAFINHTLNATTKVPNAVVNFTVSGSLGPSLPSCYFHSYPMDFLSVEAVLLGVNSDLNTIKYSCTIDLPFRYGPQIGVSIYGIVDSLGQVVGYPTSDMPATAKEFTNIASTHQGPLIDHVWRDGNKISVTGTRLYKCILIVYPENLPTVQLSSLDIATGVFIMAGNYTPSFSSTVYVSVYNIDNLEESNRLLLIKGPPVTPTPSPTPSSTPVTCSFDCGEPQGYGKCVNGACICNPPHTGLDCKAKVDNTTVITPNPVQPSVNVTIPGTSSGQTPEFISFIYVVALRELDNTDTLINNYVFNSDKWILVKEGSSSNDQVTTVQYKYLIDTYNTTIVSTVQVFTQATNITFGNQQLYMNPSTIKFTFNITSYPFSKSTNSLQLVMTAALQSTEKVACSYKEFVDDQSSSQYLKIQIEDRSLFGRFIKFGMIDGREQVVSNSILDSSYGGKELSKSTSDQSYIGLNIPYYTKIALIDPDFSVLIEQNTARDQANSICTNESSKKLTNAQLAGIIVGGVVFLFIICAVAIYFYTRNSTSPIAMKLRKLNK